MQKKVKVRSNDNPDLDEEKGKVVEVLLALAGGMENAKTIKVAAVRSVKPHPSVGPALSDKVVKPHWCSALDPPTIDFGSGQASIVEASGGQVKVWEYLKTDGIKVASPDEMSEDQAVLLANLVKQEWKTLYPEKAIEARATGKWRDNDKNMPKFEALQSEMVKDDSETSCEILSTEDEAQFGSKSVLNIIAPFYPQDNDFFIMEMGGGSTQIGIFGRYWVFDRVED